MTVDLPTAAEAAAHPVLWAMRTQGAAVVEGEEARLLGEPDGSLVPRWRPARHLWMIGDLLIDLFEGRERRVIVTLPPRHGKSTLLSRALPGWWLGRRPDDEVILASYGDSLTRGWSRRIRDDLVQHGEEVFGVTALQRSSTQEWQPRVRGLPTAGNLLATSVGGTATGKGANLLVIDDVVKGTLEARSKALRDAVWEFLVDELLTRLAPGGVAIMIGTRWHPDDPIGRLLAAQRRRAQAGDDVVSSVPWRLVELPALAVAGDPLGRQPGEALWPERYPVEALEAIRADRDPRSWDSLYQCRPAALGGEFFKQRWLRYWHLDGPCARLGEATVDLSELHTFVVADLAVSTRDRADYSVIGVFGVHVKLNVLLLLDLDRDRMEGPDMVPRIRGAMERWSARVAYIEKTVYHSSLIQQARRDGVLIRELKPDTDKKLRAVPATAAMEGGQVYLRAGARWLAEFEDELLSFPDQSVHDDQVDVLSYAVQIFRSLRGGQDERRDYRPSGGGGGGGWRIGR